MKFKLILILLVALAGVMAFTNPSIDMHKDAVKEKLEKSMQTAIDDQVDKNSKNKWGDVLGKTLGSLVGNKMVDNAVDCLVSRENHIVLSLTKCKWNGENQTVGVGAFGKVYVSDKLETVFQEFMKNNKIR